MNLTEKLKFLSLARNVSVRKGDNDDYFINHSQTDIGAKIQFYKDGHYDVVYYLTDTYPSNNYEDREIDIKALKEVEAFIENLLLNEKKENK